MSCFLTCELYQGARRQCIPARASAQTLLFPPWNPLAWLQAARIPPAWKCHSRESPNHWYLQGQHMTATKPPAADTGTCCTALSVTREPLLCRGAGRHLLLLIKTSCNTCFVSFIRGKNMALVVKVIGHRQGSMGLGAFLGCRPWSCNWSRWLHLWLSDNWEPNKSPHKYLSLRDGKQLLWTLVTRYKW